MKNNERIILSINSDELNLIKTSLNLSAAFISMASAFQEDIDSFQNLAGRIAAVSQAEMTEPVNDNVITLSAHRRQVIL